MMNNSTQASSSGPWPMAVGLLAACATTMIGVATGCEPETILYRSLVSAGIVTCVAIFMRSLWRLVDPRGPS